MTITKNSKFKEKFSYNKSGIELAHNGVRVLREISSNNVKITSSTNSNKKSLVYNN